MGEEPTMENKEPIVMGNDFGLASLLIVGLLIAVVFLLLTL